MNRLALLLSLGALAFAACKKPRTMEQMVGHLESQGLTLTTREMTPAEKEFVDKFNEKLNAIPGRELLKAVSGPGPESRRVDIDGIPAQLLRFESAGDAKERYEKMVARHDKKMDKKGEDDGDQWALNGNFILRTSSYRIVLENGKMKKEQFQLDTEAVEKIQQAFQSAR